MNRSASANQPENSVLKRLSMFGHMILGSVDRLPNRKLALSGIMERSTRDVAIIYQNESDKGLNCHFFWIFMWQRSQVTT